MVYRVLFVCLGNICRSPAAEGVFRQWVEANSSSLGSETEFEIKSAGTGDWHVGELPDPRMREAARRRGLLLESRGQQVQPQDFEHFNRVVAMDRSNFSDLEKLLASTYPEEGGELRARLRLLSEYREDPLPVDVPDPYYGGADGFEVVLDLLEEAAPAIFEDLTS